MAFLLPLPLPEEAVREHGIVPANDFSHQHLRFVSAGGQHHVVSDLFYNFYRYDSGDNRDYRAFVVTTMDASFSITRVRPLEALTREMTHAPGPDGVERYSFGDEIRCGVTPRGELAFCSRKNRVFVLDPPVYSSAGVTTGIDLVLHRVAALCGEALAAQVAQTMVMPLRRGPRDAELSPFLLHRDHLHPAVHRVQDALSQAPRQPWPLAAMADVAHTSPRHLARLFAEHAGISPKAYLQSIRLGIAQTALQAGHSVTQAADLAGFASDTQLRRAWRAVGLAGRPSDQATPLSR